MDALANAALLLLTGLTVAGLSGTIMETVAGSRLSLRAPFVCRANLSRSLVLIFMAGPFMTLNEAIAALSKGRIGPATFAVLVCLCFGWLGALGVFAVGLVERVGHPLG